MLTVTFPISLLQLRYLNLFLMKLKVHMGQSDKWQLYFLLNFTIQNI